jgi:hypothetical protein
MRFRTDPARLAVAALALSLLLGLLVGCDDDADPKPDAAAASSTAASVQALAQRCEKLGKSCGEKDKHKTKITDECKEAATQQVAKGCSDAVVALYDCYEKQLCVKDSRIWALDDFRVLADRHEKCIDERKASEACVAGGANQPK